MSASESQLGTGTFHQEAPRAASDGAVTRTIAPESNNQFPETIGYTANIGCGPSAIASGELIADRYQLTNEIARGGMGVVYAARDITLNRDVAVKLLLDRYSASSNTARRFIEEAQIAGQLQHPGIAPVHDLGELRDGRPFLAMKLIKGQTLAALLSKSKPDQTQLIDYFMGIAETIAYAHNKGVIHRDLKPGNIMVGAFREVQVMDWGLAKTLGTPSATRIAKIDTAASVSVIETNRTPDSATQAGSILGTPAYMPPEQAKGDVDRTDARSDVFALGAILCELLTGKPPYIADTFDEIRAQSIMGLTRPAIERLESSGADPELIALASRCLAPDPANRPADGAAVLHAVEEYRSHVSDRLKQVEQEKATAVVRLAEQAKRRKVLIGFGGALVVGAISFACYQNIQNIRLEAQTIKAQRAQEYANKAKEESESNAQLAQKRLEKAVEAVEQVMVRVAGEKWALRADLQKERREVLEEAVSYFNNLGTEDSKDVHVRKQAARANLFAAGAYVSLAEYDKCKDVIASSQSLYRGLQSEYPNDSTYIRGEAEAEAILGHCDAISARFNSALEHYQKVLKLAEFAVTTESNHDENKMLLIDANSSLALFYSFQRPDLAKQYHAKALLIGEAILAKPAPGFKVRLAVATSLTNLAISEIATKPDEAAKKFDRAKGQLTLLEKMTPPSSRTAEMFVSTKAGLLLYQGMLSFQMKKMGEGLASAKSGVEMISQMLKVQPKSFPFQIQHIQFQIILADLLLNAERTAEATAIMANVAEEQANIAREQPQLSWIRGLGIMQKSNLIIYKLREKYDPEFEEWGRQLMDVDSQYGGPGLKYNIACLYAQAAALAPEKDRAKFAMKAIEYLNQLVEHTDYFQSETNVKHLDKDNDLDPLRVHDDFKKFMQKAKAKITVTPPPP